MVRLPLNYYIIFLLLHLHFYFWPCSRYFPFWNLRFFPLSTSLLSFPHFLFSTQQSHYRPENACQNKIFFYFTLMWTSAAFCLTASNILFSGNILLFSKLVVFESKLIYKERSNMEMDSHTLFCKYLICWYHNIVPNFLIQTHVFLWP